VRLIYLSHELVEILARTGFRDYFVSLVYDGLLNLIGLIIYWIVRLYGGV
jgi:hypothetical protein